MAEQRDQHAEVEQPTKQPGPLAAFEEALKQHHFASHSGGYTDPGGRCRRCRNDQRHRSPNVTNHPVKQAGQKTRRSGEKKTGVNNTKRQ